MQEKGKDIQAYAIRLQSLISVINPITIANNDRDRQLIENCLQAELDVKLNYSSFLV